MKFPLNGEELKSTFGNNREPNKWHSPSGSTSELYGALLEDLGPASAPSSWVDPLDSFSFTMLCQDRTKRGAIPRRSAVPPLRASTRASSSDSGFRRW